MKLLIINEKIVFYFKQIDPTGCPTSILKNLQFKIKDLHSALRQLFLIVAPFCEEKILYKHHLMNMYRRAFTIEEVCCLDVL